jgi:hypothetical protein
MEEIGLAEKVRQRFLTNTTDRYVGLVPRRQPHAQEDACYASPAPSRSRLVADEFDNPAVTAAKRSISHKDIAR